jgi:hypothetical protein
MARHPTPRREGALVLLALLAACSTNRADRPDRGDTGLGAGGKAPSTDVRPDDSVRSDSARAGTLGDSSVQAGDTLATAPLAVSGIMLGSSVTEDNLISSPKTTFTPRDTFHISVSLTGQSTGQKLTARWIYEGGEGGRRVIHESTETIPEGQNAVAAFHVSQGAPWPKGRYTVRVLLDGENAGERAFTVQ